MSDPAPIVSRGDAGRTDMISYSHLSGELEEARQGVYSSAPQGLRENRDVSLSLPLSLSPAGLPEPTLEKRGKWGGNNSSPLKSR